MKPAIGPMIVIAALGIGFASGVTLTYARLKPRLIENAAPMGWEDASIPLPPGAKLVRRGDLLDRVDAESRAKKSTFGDDPVAGCQIVVDYDGLAKQTGGSTAFKSGDIHIEAGQVIGMDSTLVVKRQFRVLSINPKEGTFNAVPVDCEETRAPAK